MCHEPLPVDGSGDLNCFYPCCSQCACVGCYVKWLEAGAADTCPYCRAPRETEPAKFVAQIERGARRGHGNAQYFLAMALLEGQCQLQRDEKRGMALLELAAAQQQTRALVTLGRFYSPLRQISAQHQRLASLGFKENPRKTLQCFRAAAELGDMKGQCELGTLYHTGSCVKLNPAEASQTLKRRLLGGEALATRGHTGSPRGHHLPRHRAL